jgi:co-chaperonin GroES (HSP10)
MPAIKEVKLEGNLKALNDTILVHNMEKGMLKTSGGIIMPDDNMKERGIRPRWCQVYAIGKGVSDVKVGQWILVQHGRWTHGIEIKDADGQAVYLQKIEPESILLVRDDK